MHGTAFNPGKDDMNDGDINNSGTEPNLVDLSDEFGFENNSSSLPMIKFRGLL